MVQDQEALRAISQWLASLLESIDALLKPSDRRGKVDIERLLVAWGRACNGQLGV